MVRQGGVAVLNLALRTLLFALLLVGAPARPGWAQDLQGAEYRIKAAFVCKFGNYVEWPPLSDGGPVAFGIGVLGPVSVIDEVVAAARGQTVNGQPIAVRRLERGDSVEGLSIVFVARSHAARLPDVLAAVKDRPVLTVTESEQGAAAGVAVNFVVVDNKVRFDVSLAAAEHARLKVSARLLGVARRVSGGAS